MQRLVMLDLTSCLPGMQPMSHLWQLPRRPYHRFSLHSTTCISLRAHEVSSMNFTRNPPSLGRRRTAGRCHISVESLCPSPFSTVIQPARTHFPVLPHIKGLNKSTNSTFSCISS